MDSSRMTVGSMEDDVMMASTYTYTVGRPFDTYELNTSLLSELDMSNHNSVTASMVLDHPIFDQNMLPMIGDEELETPIYIPNRTMNATLASNQPKMGDKKANTGNYERTTSNVCSRTNLTANQVPKYTPAPKKPTKNQLIYEKLKQSLEQDKNKPKKEVKSKVSESLKTFAAPKDPKVISREPSTLKSKTLTGSSQVKMRPPTTVTRPVSMTQAPVSRKPAASPSRPTAARPNSITLKSKPDNKSNGSSSKPHTPLRPPTSKSINSLATTNAEKRLQEMDKKLSEIRKLAQHNEKGFDAFVILFNHINKAHQQQSYDLNCSYDEIFSTGKANEELKSIIQDHIEQSSKSMDEMNRNFDLILKEKSEDYEGKIEYLKEQYEHQISVLERQLAEEKERHKIVPVSLKSGEPNVCKGDCNDEIRSLEMTLQLKNEEIHALRGETRELELKTESLNCSLKSLGALNAQLERMTQYVKQARENEKLMTKDLATVQNELMDIKRKNVDLQQRLDIFHYKMGEDAEMISSTHSNSSTGTRSIHDPVFPVDRTTPERPHSNEMSVSTMIWSSAKRRTKPKVSHDEIFDNGGRIDFNESLSSMPESNDGVNYASSESSSKENNATNDL